MKHTVLVALALLSLCLAGCSHKTATSYYSSPTTYLNHEGDGSITVRAYGSGRNGQDAREQAWKNAVHDVIFKGINVPGNTLLSKPLITEVNAEEKYEQFFNIFFKDQGYFMSFITTEDKKPFSTNFEKNTIQNKQGTTVRVLRAELKDYLKQNGILK